MFRVKRILHYVVNASYPFLIFYVGGYLLTSIQEKVNATYDARYFMLAFPVLVATMFLTVILLSQKPGRKHLISNFIGLFLMIGTVILFVFVRWRLPEPFFQGRVTYFILRNVYALFIVVAIYIYLCIRDMKYLLKNKAKRDNHF